MSQAARSLMSRHPRRLDLPALLVVSLGLLLAGFSLPTLTMTKVIFFTDTYSIWGGIVELWKSDHFLLAAVIFFFSMIFPLGKLVMLATIWFAPMTETVREKSLHWLGVLGKWSMLDVFVVATLVVLIKAGDLADATAGIGIYLFAAAIVTTNITSQLMHHLAGDPNQ